MQLGLEETAVLSSVPHSFPRFNWREGGTGLTGPDLREWAVRFGWLLILCCCSEPALPAAVGGKEKKKKESLRHTLTDRQARQPAETKTAATVPRLQQY